MIVDLDKYSASKSFCLSWFQEKGNGDVGYSVATLAGMTFVPAIIVACWLGELTKWNPATIKTVKRLIEFYGYTKIEGLPDGSPKFL